MTEYVFARIARFGRELAVLDESGNEAVCRGFLQPVDTLDY